VSDVTGVTTHDVPRPTGPGPGRPEPPGDGSGGGDRPGRGGPALWQVVLLVIALCGLAGVIGWRIGDGSSSSHPGSKSVDVGFYEDMTTHHQQAITMALDYLRNGDDPLLLQMAREIVTYQSSEIGTMNTYLGQWGVTGQSPRLAMGWMQPPVPRDQMPGLATPAQLQRLENARGAELDALFTELMINHHGGGVHMAANAAERAELASTRKLAANMDDGQRGEISEMNSWRTRHGLPTIVPPLAEFTPPAKTGG
jgi:uncharacterized protein (DUF305 family)